MEPINCTAISMYTTSGFLKSTMSCQLFCSLISLFAIFATQKRVFSSILLDSAFKEHLICCYLIHIIQSVTLSLLQGILLFQHLTQPPCLGTIPALLCDSLRLSAGISTISLPSLNLNLAFFRYLSFFGGFVLKKNETMLRRGITLMVTIAFSLEYYWKVSAYEVYNAQVPYCIAKVPGWAEKANIEMLLTGTFEIITILSAFLLVWLYKRKDRLQRSYIISVNLRRRQLMHTMQLFLPYSVFHAFSFVAFAICSPAYRKIFGYLQEPNYSSGSGYFFFPMYFTAISPWLIYWIVVKTEKNRLNKISDLTTLERNQAKNVYFENLRLQWESDKSFIKSQSSQNLLFRFWR